MAELTGKAVSELPEATNAQNSDLLAISQDATSKKVTVETLLKRVTLNYIQGGTNYISVPYQTIRTIASFDLPSGVWFVSNYMTLEQSGTGVFNNIMEGDTVRSSEANGGGCVNAKIITGPKTVEIQTYHNISPSSGVRTNWYAFKISE